MSAGKPLSAADIEAAFANAAVKDIRYCGLGNVIHTHEHGQIIAQKVNDAHLYSAKMISRVLKSLGMQVSPDVIQRHRRGVCRCPEES